MRVTLIRMIDGPTVARENQNYGHERSLSEIASTYDDFLCVPV